LGNKGGGKRRKETQVREAEKKTGIYCPIRAWADARLGEGKGGDNAMKKIWSFVFEIVEGAARKGGKNYPNNKGKKKRKQNSGLPR